MAENPSVGYNVVRPGGQMGMELLFGPGMNFGEGYTKYGTESETKSVEKILGGPNSAGFLSSFPDTLRWGQAGGFVAPGNRVSNIYNPNDPALGDPRQRQMTDNSSLGILGAMYGSQDGSTQGAYQRFADSEGHYDRVMRPFETVATRPMGANLGSTWYGPQGQTMGQTGSEYDMFRTFVSGQNDARQNPYLDPAARVSMARVLERDAPYGRPDPMGWVGQQASQFGQGPQTSGIANLLVGGTAGLGNAYEGDLMAAIDREAQLTLANQLQETQGILGGAGLGRSGAGQRQLQANQSDILSQANRDKIRALAEMREGNLGRTSQAISQGAGMMGQETAAEQARRGQLLGQGFGSQFQSLEGSRAAERGILGAGFGDTTQMYQGDMGRDLQALTSSDQAALARTMGEQQMQSQGLTDWMRMMGYREGTRSNRLGEMLDLEDRQRSMEAERQASQQYFNMLPWNSFMQMVTGVQPQNAPSTGRQSPWAGVGPQIAADVGSSFLSGGGYQLPSYIMSGNYQP